MGAKPYGGFYRGLMVTSWGLEIITYNAVAMRTAVGLLTGIATSMIASIALDGHGVPLESLASVSMIR
jgi:hypothetical protein